MLPTTNTTITKMLLNRYMSRTKKHSNFQNFYCNIVLGIWTINAFWDDVTVWKQLLKSLVVFLDQPLQIGNLVFANGW